jgi:Tfp pilus assembly protein PilN
MNRLNWNFAPGRWGNWSQAAFCIVALSGCLHAIWWRHDLLLQRESLVDEAQESSRHASTLAKRVTAPTPAALNQVFAEMRYPWTEMLDSLQRLTQPGVELLTLEPDPGAVRRIHISGVARQASDMFDLVSALQNDPAWSSVQLSSQTRNDPTNVFQPVSTALPALPDAVPSGVSFSLIAEWGRP